MGIFDKVKTKISAAEAASKLTNFKDGFIGLGRLGRFFNSSYTMLMFLVTPKLQI